MSTPVTAPLPAKQIAEAPSLAARAKRFIAGDEAGPAPVTNTIIVANVLVYVAMAIHARSATALISMPEEAMQYFGANRALFTVGDGRIETLLSSCFLHWSLLHLGFNMIALRQVGPFVERAVGPARFAPLYVLSGALGSVASALWGWERNAGQISAGASGAICGIIGAAMVLGARTQGLRGPLAMGMARWLGGILILGAIAHFDNAAHVGGAVAGAAIAGLWQRGRTYKPALERAIVGAMTALCLVSGGAVYWKDTHDPLVFADEDARRRLVVHYMVRGQCDGARTALHRAENLNPKSADTRDLEIDLMRHCQ